MIIRSEKSGDVSKIFEINTEAFSSDDEAYLVDNVRAKGIPMISLVAEENKTLVGHILFTEVRFIDRETGISVAGLGPMAVRPEWQRQGIGGKLVEEGFKQCRKAGYHAVVVLGYESYYPRFGFVPSVDFGINSTYDVPPAFFMVRELKKGSLKGVGGTICYDELFIDSP